MHKFQDNPESESNHSAMGWIREGLSEGGDVADQWATGYHHPGEMFHSIDGL